jgi:hypothetical protein
MGLSLSRKRARDFFGLAGEDVKVFWFFSSEKNILSARAVCDLIESLLTDASRSSPLFWRECLSGG